MARRSKKSTGLMAEAIASAELAQIESVMAVRLKVPVWLHTHKAKAGDVITLDPGMALQLIERGQADVVD